MADALRGSMDAAEYKHVVLGLIFLKYTSDAFEETHALAKSRSGVKSADPEDRDEYMRPKHLLGAAWKPAGAISRLKQSFPPSANSSMTPWPAYRATTTRC